MITMGKKALAVAIILSPMMTDIVWADEAELVQRIERLERLIKGQGLVSLLGRVDQLQNEIQGLNGDNESLRHQLEVMQQRQRELYLDIDQRIVRAQTAVIVPPAPVEFAVAPPVITEPKQQPAGEQHPPQQPSLDSEPVSATQEPVAPATQPVAVDNNGEAAYQSVVQTLRSGQYEQAVAALVSFSEQYPQSSYLPNAYYWQGDANYILGNFDLAIVAFQTVIDQFPASSKVADAKLKLGFSQYELGDAELAQSTLMLVIEQYPNTSVSRLAKARLDQIKQQTR